MKTYDPTTDSSEQTFGLTGLVLCRAEGYCLCGCMEPTAPKRQFRIGHDARLKGKLIRAYLADAKIQIVNDVTDDGLHQVIERTAMQDAEAVGPSFVDALKRQDSKVKSKPAAEPKTMSVKVGRWTYDGTVVGEAGDKLVVEYKTAKGEVKFVEVAK